jgi:preprotein translocase subunit YajC
MIRPQMKRQKEMKVMLEALAAGDEVITVGGILGKVTAVKDQYITVEIVAGTEVQMQKGAVTSVLPKGTIKSV